MTQQDHSAAAAVPPHVQVVQLAIGGIVSKVVYTAARLGLADRLAAGPRTAADVAGELDAHPRSLHRFMRTLASFGLLAEGEGGRFGLTPLGEALRADAPGHARSAVLTLLGPTFAAGLDQLEHSVRTGETGFEKVYGVPAFDYLAQHADEAKLFGETMIGLHGTEPPAVAAAYDFAGLRTIVDVGGGTGNLLGTVLARHAGPRGVLFDLPHAIAAAPPVLATHGVTDRVTLETGNFFEAVPAGADAYVLSHVIHDWSEAQCLAILASVRKAMRPDSRLLLVEMVLPPGDAPHPGKLLDMIMLSLPGGTERTEPEYAELLAKAGFKLARVVPTASPVSVVEALPA